MLMLLFQGLHFENQKQESKNRTRKNRKEELEIGRRDPRRPVLKGPGAGECRPPLEAVDTGQSNLS